MTARGLNITLRSMKSQVTGEGNSCLQGTQICLRIFEFKEDEASEQQYKNMMHFMSYD